MNGLARRGVALAAAVGALHLACAHAQVAAPAAGEYRPAQRSALVGARTANFVVARWPGSTASTTLLAHRQDAAMPRPVARLVQVRRGTDWQVSVQHLPGPSAATGDELAALEQLYALVLHQEPLARYCMGGAVEPCDPARDGVSHARVLQNLAALRARAAAHDPAAVPWRVVEIEATLRRAWDADVVAVRAMLEHTPLQDVVVHFNRAPHSICAARTDADGVATCRLEDQHADGHQHDHATVVIATFPGHVRTDRVLLPTTAVLPAPPAAAQPAFARPITLPPGPP
jgi:hypothetical protein